MRTTRYAPLAVAVTVLAGAPGAHAAAADPIPKQLVVDLADRTGPVRHGANGALYGLSDPGVPSDNLLQPLKIRAIAGKAPGGLQHPNGDTLVVADQFVRTGGQDIHVYLQDFYPNWPYDDLGFADYLPKIERIAAQVAAHPQRDHVVYVPFNEPDWIWYGLSTADPAAYPGNRDRFLADWTTAFRTIRRIDPGARIAGPNEAFFDRRFLPDFLAYAKANAVLPDVMTWHELPTLQLERYRQDYAGYRVLERAAGVGPLPVNINEFAGRRDLSVPGHLVQWVAMFEDTKVDAGGQAYWDAAGNLSGNASQTNRPTGSWWMFKMYADLTGQTVRVTVPQLNRVDTLQGLAAVDGTTRQAHVLFGGEGGDTDVVLRGVDPAVFGTAVHLTLARTDWSGYDADAPPPAVLTERDLVPVGPDGTLTVPVRGMDPMSAYELVVSPGGHGTSLVQARPWQARYEAEQGEIVSGQVFTQGTPQNFNGYAASGTRDVGSLNRPDSSVTVTATVPATGAYDVGILYGNQSGGPAQQVLTVDGGQAQFVAYPVTLNWLYRARATATVQLTAGTHRITLATTGPIGAARGEVTLDRIDLTAVPPAPPTQRYEAERAQPTGPVEYRYDSRRQSGAGYVRLPPGSSTSFVVSVPADGYYEVATRYAIPERASGPAALLTLDGGPLDGAVLDAARALGPVWETAVDRVYLTAGVHRLGVRPTGTPAAGVEVDRMTVRPAPGAVQRIEAEAAGNTLTGGAVVQPNPFASGGASVTGVGGTGTLTVPVAAPRAGQYTLVVHYANDERSGEHTYNTNIVSRATDISVNGGPAQRVWLRNTWDWNNFWSVGIPIDLAAGQNSVTLARADGTAPVFDLVEVAPTLEDR